MSKVVSFVYYRLFKLSKFMAMGLSSPHYRAAFLGSLATYFNVLSLCLIFGGEISKRASVAVVITYTGWYFLWVQFFRSQKLYERAMKEFNSEEFFQSVVGNLLTGMYILSSVFTFVVVRAKFS